MIIYLVIIILVFLFSKQLSKKNFNLFDYLILGLMIIVCGLRYHVGSDYELYTEMYNHLELYPRTEFIVTLIINILNSFNFSANAFFFVMAAITISLFYVAIKRCSSFPAQSVFLFIALGYYAMCFNGIRQMLAAAICLFATKYFLKRNTKMVLITVGLASLCHTTALIMIPAYFISRVKFSKKTYLIIFAISASAVLFYNPILMFLTSHFEQYSMYAVKNSMTYWAPGMGTYIIGLFHFFVHILCIIKLNRLESISKNNRIYLNLMMLSTVFFSLSFANALLVRIAYYFSIYLIFLIPDLLKVYFGKKNDRNYLVVIIFFILYYIIHLISFNQMLPYNWIFSL